jgi:anaerobic dimethyl sulfoxide reductase subunit C (anchor subunit)
MHVSEWPLVVFTILAQMAVGSFVVLGAVQLLARRHSDVATVDKLSRPALYAIGPVMVGGMLASLFHLGNPLNVFNVLNGLGSSWLSREIFFGSAFAVAGAAFAVCQWRGWLTPLLRQVLAGVTAAIGLVLVLSMSMVYMLDTVPAWNTWLTPLTFFVTAFLLGSLAVGAAFVVEGWVRKARGKESDPAIEALTRGTLRGVGIASIVLLAVEFVTIPTYSLWLTTDGSAAAGQSAAALMAGGGAWFVARLVLVALGAGVLGFFLYRTASKGTEKILAITAVSAFALVLVAETLGRVLFYNSMFHVGI